MISRRRLRLSASVVILIIHRYIGVLIDSPSYKIPSRLPVRVTLESGSIAHNSLCEIVNASTDTFECSVRYLSFSLGHPYLPGLF